MSKDLGEILTEISENIDEFLLNSLPKSHEVKEISLLYDMMRDYPNRPKKGLRPALCILACQAFDGKFEQIIPTAAAIEIFQNWVLIHDDVEDGSELRRGKPVLHRLHGIPLAINAGDALHAKMWEVLLLNRVLLGEPVTLDIIGEMVKMVNETTEGQHMELAWVKEHRWDLKDKDYMLMTEKKTAWYTCITPLRLGTIVAGAPSRILPTITEFGRKLGVSFQIRDDVLNLVGDERRYGKEVGGDILEGKRTLIMIRLLEICSSEEKKKLVSRLEKPREEKGEDDMRYVMGLLKKYGALERVSREAEDMASEALSVFDEIFGPLPPSGAKQELRKLVEFMVKREW